MSSFTDTKGRKWPVEVTVDTVRRIRRVLEIDLLGPNLPEVLERLFADQVLLCDVLYVAVQHDAETHGVTADEFGRSMAGDALEEGAKALLFALRDFTPNRRDRERVGKLVETILAAAERFRDQADETLERESERLLAEMGTGAPSSSSPASPASSPGDTPSGS